MKRGQIYYITSNHQERGSEQRADRPAVIVSNDKNNENSEVVEIVYLTTRPKTDLPTHVFTRSALSPSTILCEQIYSVSKQRIGTLIGELTENEIQALDAALAISLGIDFENLKGPEEIRAQIDEKEVAAMLEALKSTPLQVIPDSEAKKEADTLLEQLGIYETMNIRLETERDLYRQLYNELLGTLTKGAQP